MTDPRPRRTLADLLEGIEDAVEYSSPALARLLGIPRSTAEKRFNTIDRETGGMFWHTIGGQKRAWGYKVKAAFGLVRPAELEQRFDLAEARIEDHEERLRVLERPSGVLKVRTRAPARRRAG